MKLKTKKTEKDYLRGLKECSNIMATGESSFWNKWLILNELDQEQYVQKIVPIIEGHWSALDKIGKKISHKEVLRLKASLLNSYFIDLVTAVYAQTKKTKKK